MRSKKGMQRRKSLVNENQKEPMAETELDEELRDLQAGDERRCSNASQSNGCCMDPAFLQNFVATGADLVGQTAAFASLKRVWKSVWNAASANATSWRREKEEKKTRRSSKEERRVAPGNNQRQGTAMKGFQVVLFLILLCLQGLQVNAMETSSFHLRTRWVRMERGVDENRDPQGRSSSSPPPPSLR